MANIEHVRAYQDRHRAAGLCLGCSRPATCGQLCEEHAANNRARSAAFYARRRAALIEAGALVPCPNRPHRCGFCGETGHNQRTCSALMVR